MAIEENFSELEAIIEKLDNKDISLSDAFSEYEKGIKLIKDCNDSLDKVEKDIVELKNNTLKTGEGEYDF